MNVTPISLRAHGERRNQRDINKPWVLQEKETTSWCWSSRLAPCRLCPAPATLPLPLHIKCTKAVFSSTTVFGYKGCSRKLLFWFWGALLTPPACLAFGLLYLVYFHFTTGILAPIFHALLHLCPFHVPSSQQDKMSSARLCADRARGSCLRSWTKAPLAMERFLPETWIIVFLKRYWIHRL